MNRKIFVGRAKELKQLEALSDLGHSSLVVINGRRRVGKSRLIREFAKDRIFLSFAGLAPADAVTGQDQRNAFANQLAAYFHMPPFSFSDWLDGFAHLSRYLTEQPTLILLDEISWMGSGDPTFLPKLKLWWDQISEERSHLTLVLCGSVSTWIEENIIKSTAFFGRVSLHLTLEPLTLAESAQLLSQRSLRASSYDLFRILAVAGGIPWYLENIQPSDSIDENIKRLCFSPNGLLVKEFNLIFHDLFDRKGEVYKKIVSTLAEGMRDYTQIREALKYPEGGALSSYLEALMTSGYVTKHQSWSIKTGKPAQKSLFRLSDNYLRFYLKTIEPLLGKIRSNSLLEVPLSAIPGVNSLMGLQVENLLLNNRHSVLKSIGIYPQDVVMDNPYLQRATQTQEGLQIDYLIQTKTKTLYLCEFKFSRHELKSDVIAEIQKKIDKLVLPRGFSVCPVLFHISGVSDTILDAQYFYRMIDIGNFLG